MYIYGAFMIFERRWVGDVRMVVKGDGVVGGLI